MTPEQRLEPLAKLYPAVNAGQLLRRIRAFTGRDDFNGMKILDVGAGEGLDSCAMSLLGADEIIALEPEMDGSTQDPSHTFRQHMHTLGLNNISLRAETIEQYPMQANTFDLIVLIAVVNHLDEAATMTLHHDENARERFRSLLQPLYQGLKPGGTLSLFDASRHHIFSPLINWGLMKGHPLHPSIEWHKHQQPWRWARLLREVGFVATQTRWSKPRGLPIPLWNSILHPYFTLQAQKPTSIKP